MKIETLVNLVGGELLNSPYISEVTSFTDECEKVSRGGCFFVKDKKDIPLAIKNGAYAVISENYEDIIDREIAWIKVEDIDRSVIDVFKYEHLNAKVYICDEITEEIISKMNLSPNVFVLKNTKDLLNALNIQNKFLITSKKEYEELFALKEILSSSHIELLKLSMFKSKYKNYELNLPYVYKEEFAKALKFFEDNDIKYTLEFELERFKPVFVDYRFRKVDYGQSEKVVILGVKNDRFFIREINYFIQETKHAKSIVVDEYNKELLNSQYNFAMSVDMDVEFNESDENGSLL